MAFNFASLLITAAAVLLAVQIVLLWRLVRLSGEAQRRDERLAQLSDAMSLLTEATESGFRTIAAELERQADGTRARPAKTVSVTRVAAAARRGRSHAEIAASEGVSEGEIALRLHLAGQGRDRAHDARRKPRAAKAANGTAQEE